MPNQLSLNFSEDGGRFQGGLLGLALVVAVTVALAVGTGMIGRPGQGGAAEPESLGVEEVVRLHGADPERFWSLCHQQVPVRVRGFFVSASPAAVRPDLTLTLYDTPDGSSSSVRVLLARNGRLGGLSLFGGQAVTVTGQLAMFPSDPAVYLVDAHLER